MNFLFQLCRCGNWGIQFIRSLIRSVSAMIKTQDFWVKPPIIPVRNMSSVIKRWWHPFDVAPTLQTGDAVLFFFLTIMKCLTLITYKELVGSLLHDDLACWESWEDSKRQGECIYVCMYAHLSAYMWICMYVCLLLSIKHQDSTMSSTWISLHNSCHLSKVLQNTTVMMLLFSE